MLPVEITASFDAMRVSRTFALRARPPSYPHTELRSLSLSPARWLRAGRTDVPALTLPAFDLTATGIEHRVSISATPGVAVNQILAALDRYPYGCLEQVSSATRGLIFREQIESDRSGSARDRINQIRESIASSPNRRPAAPLATGTGSTARGSGFNRTRSKP